MVNPTAPGWTKENSDLLRQFLDGGTGQLFLLQLSTSRPSLTAEPSDLATVALNAKVVAGYERALAVIQGLMEPPVKLAGDKASEYVDLDSPMSEEEKSNLGL